MTNVFISYRRDDAGGHAGRLSDRLVARFGDARVFVDVQDIQPGQNFEQAIDNTLARCDHLLAVIGPRWVEALRARATGDDFVRHEVVKALARGMTVIPVLVGGAKMPAVADLPAEMAAFARCHAVEVRDAHFDEDASRLVRFLAGAGGDGAGPLMGGRVDRRVAIGLGAALVAAAVILWGVWGRTVERPAPIEVPQDLRADIAGEWVAEMGAPGPGRYRIRLTLARAGDVVTGTVRYPTGEAGVLDGRMDGNTVTFHTRHVPQFESVPATIQVTGTLQDDVLRLTVTSESGAQTGVATRVRAAASGADARPARALPSLAYGVWTLRNANDERGQTWNNSVLQFTSQQETPDGLELRGRFTWRLSDELRGTEEVTGRYVDRTRQVILEGTAVADAAGLRGTDVLAVGSYSAVLSADERSLVDGRWGSTADNEPGVAGTWEAVR